MLILWTGVYFWCLLCYFFFVFLALIFLFSQPFFFLWFVYFFSDIVAGWTYFLVTLLAESWTLSLFVRSEFQGISISLILGLRDEYEPDFTLSIFPLFIFLVFSISFPTPQLNPIPKTCPSVPNKSSPINCGHNSNLGSFQQTTWPPKEANMHFIAWHVSGTDRVSQSKNVDTCQALMPRGLKAANAKGSSDCIGVLSLWSR